MNIKTNLLPFNHQSKCFWERKKKKYNSDFILFVNVKLSTNDNTTWCSQVSPI